jgi:two-component system, OmpR family, phosphate regulon sensor histidine kinase PhoR
LNAGVRLKLFAISLALVVGVGLVSGIYLERQLRGWLIDRIELELLGQARLARDLIETAASLGDARVADVLADRMGHSTGLRITIVDGGGAVLGDSSLSMPEIAQVENHRARPEIRQALAEGQGAATRYSMSVHTDMLYMAVPFQRPEMRGVVRAAMALSEVDSVAARLRWVVFVAGLLGLGLAVCISGVASHLALRPLRSLVRNARLVTSGSESIAQRLPVSSNDEIGRLAGSFNELVDELDQTLSSLAGERDRLETILGGMTEALLALDPNDRVTHANQAAIDLLALGHSPVGHSLVEIVRVPMLGELMERIHAQPAAVVESELSLPPARQVLARAASIKSTGGTILVMLDISEMRRTSARCAGWRRCAAISSPTSRTSCARRSASSRPTRRRCWTVRSLTPLAARSS